MTTFKIQHYINGQFLNSDNYLESKNPTTLEVIAHVPKGSPELILEAVDAAEKAFDNWSTLPMSKRCALLNRLADLVEQNIDELALLESKDQGKTLAQARQIEMPRVVLNFRCFANSPLYMTENTTEQDEFNAINIQTRNPVGVTAIITPWNLPLYLLSFKLAPCLIYGNTCVCKPSEFTSLTAWRLCQLIDEAGFPPGVINMVFGDGPTTGDVLIRNSKIKLITFTGSTFTGGLIEKATAGQFKKLSLEMGGKNAAIIYEDAELESTVSSCIRSSFLNQGEVCLCTSRIFVQEKIYEQFLEAFIRQAKSLVVGDPLEKDTFMGPVVSAAHMDKIIGYLKKTKGKIRCGYGLDKLQLDSRLENGYFIKPTIVTDLEDEDPLMIDEVFGPVTAIVPFKSTEEVISRVNKSRYGLCASVYTKDQSIALKTAKKLEVGTVWINCWLIRDLRMPFGGYKMSGIGREGLFDSRDFYTETKTLCIKY